MIELRRRHGALAEAVRRAEAHVEELRFDACPARADLAPLLEHTAAIARALAEFLAALDEALGNDGAAGRLGPDEVASFLLEVEPPEKPTDAFHPAVPRRASAIGRLPALYGFFVAHDNDFYKRRAPRSYAWKQASELWTRIVYCGGTHASGGLLARLDRLSALPGVRTGPRAAAYYPWDRDDIAELGRIADRADHLRTADDERLLEDARKAWCETVDGWLAHPEAARGVLARLAVDAPEPNPEVTARLTAIRALTAQVVAK